MKYNFNKRGGRKMDYKKLLDSYAYESDCGIKSRIEHSDGSNAQENKDIINEIVLWKINRSVGIKDELICQIRDLKINDPNDASTNPKVNQIIIELLHSDGIQIAMASTILKMFHPDIFPIIDQRAYRELFNEEMPKYYSKDATVKYADTYQNYIQQCYLYQQNNCPYLDFNDIDKILYQIDKEKGFKVKY